MRSLLRVLLVLVLLPSITLIGCDSGGDGDTSISGMWEGHGDDEIFVLVSSTSIKIYDYLGDASDQGPDCYEYSTLNIASHDGNNYTVADPEIPDFQIVMTLKRSGDNLTVTAFGESQTFYPSSRTVGSFTPQCASKQGSGKWMR